MYTVDMGYCVPGSGASVHLQPQFTDIDICSIMSLYTTAVSTDFLSMCNMNSIPNCGRVPLVLALLCTLCPTRHSFAQLGVILLGHPTLLNVK